MIGAVGILCPFLIFNYGNKSIVEVPFYIFSVYSILFGVLLILVEFKIKLIIKIFLFVASYNHRAIFMIFLGTLAMCAYSRLDGKEWIGYVIGGSVMFIGVLHIMVGCFDEEWVKEQNNKYLPQVVSPSQPALQSGQYPAPGQQPWAGAGAGQGQGPNAIDAFYAQHAAPAQATPQQYPSLASDSAMMSQAAQMPETQRLATAATTATVQNMFRGQTAEQAAANAFTNPEVQSLALSAGMAAAQNPAMQAAALTAASNAMSSATSAAGNSLRSAYDQLFDD